MNGEFIRRYKDQRDRLRKQFEAEKVGEQTLFSDQAKLFKPLIASQNQTAKVIGDKIASSQDVLSNTLVPFTRELNRRNEQLDTLQSLPFYPGEIEGITQSTPIKAEKIINVDLDGELVNQTHSENLQDMGLDLPSKVQRQGTYEEALSQIVVEKRRIGQFLGKSSKKNAKEKEIYESQKKTLELYKKKIKGLEGAKQFIKKSGEGLRRRVVKPKSGRGRPRIYPDVIVYNNPDDLVVKLSDFATARRAGNTGVDNYINEILDELLRIKAIDKDCYDRCFRTIFTNI